MYDCHCTVPALFNMNVKTYSRNFFMSRGSIKNDSNNYRSITLTYNKSHHNLAPRLLHYHIQQLTTQIHCKPCLIMSTQKCTPVSSWMHSIPTSTSWCRVAGKVVNHCVSAAALSPAVALPPAPLSRAVEVCAHGRMELSHSKQNRVVSE